MRFGAILALLQGWSNQGSQYVLCRFSWNWVLKVDLGTHLGDKHGHLFLWYLEIFSLLFNNGQTKVENMHFLQLSWNWVLKVDLGTHLGDKHGPLFLWDFEIFWPLFMVGKTNVENMHFCQLSWNWVLRVDLGTHLKDKHGYLFLWYLELFWPSFKDGQTNIEKMHFWWLSQELNFESGFRYVPIWEISMDTYFYEIWSYFGPRSRLVKPSLKMCTFVDFLEIEFWMWI